MKAISTFVPEREDEQRRAEAGDIGTGDVGADGGGDELDEGVVAAVAAAREATGDSVDGVGEEGKEGSATGDGDGWAGR